MRVGFFGQSGPYAPPALRYLLGCQEGFELALVVEGRRAPVGRREHVLLQRRPAVALPPESEDLPELAVAAGLPVLRTCEVNAPAAIRHVQDHEVDLIVCVGFDRLFAPELLAAAPRGGINAHPSRLPEWRGPSPIFWALKEGRRDLSLTLHALDEGEDHGAIYVQESFVLPHRASGEDIYDIAGRLAARLMAPLLSRLAAGGGLDGRPQEHHRATRAPRPKPEDALVDPLTWGCEHLVDFACGAPFFRAPWFKLGDDVFFARRGLKAEPGRALPAQYVQQGDLLVVQCADGVAHLEVQT